MDRTSYYMIGGKQYPLRFGYQATRKLIERFGSIEKMADAMTSGDMGSQLDDIIYIVQTLIAQGCAYKNIFEADVPAPKDAPVVGGKWIPLTAEELEVGLDLSETDELLTAIYQTYAAAQKKEVASEGEKKTDINAG